MNNAVFDGHLILSGCVFKLSLEYILKKQGCRC